MRCRRHGYGDAGGAALTDPLLEELSRARESGRRVPDFFIVGHAKCGTTAMYEMLRAHRQIHMASPKETQFLARGPVRGAEGPEDVRGPRIRTLDAYLAAFEQAQTGQRAGEASTTYLRTPEAAERIAALSPQARIIAILREPADFLRSLHLQLLEAGLERERDLAKALALEPERRRGRMLPADSFWAKALLYSDHVRYVEQLRRFHSLFGEDRVLVLVYDDFRDDNERVMRRLYRFLGVEDAPGSQRSSANPTVRVRSHRAQALLNSLSVPRTPTARALKAGVQAVVPARLRRNAQRAANSALLDTRPQAPRESTIRELRERFDGEVRATSDYLGRDLVGLWGYDRRG